MSFASKFWNFLINRSPQNAAKQAASSNIPDAQSTNIPQGVLPFETFSKVDKILGLQVQIGTIETGFKTPAGQLARNEMNLHALLGCGHIVHQFQPEEKQGQHIIGIAGKCVFCEKDYSKAVKTGEIDPATAERLSLICTDCAKITVSGQLCCPRHYATVVNPDDSKTYLSPDDIEAQREQNTLNMLFGPLAALFSEDKKQSDSVERQK